MNKREMTGFFRDNLLHILLVVFGLVLVLDPDGAAALVTKLLGWVLVAVGAVQLVVPALEKRTISAGLWVGGGVLILGGVILLSRPLILANLIGRVLGVLLLVEGLQNIRRSGKVLAAVTIVAGVVLILMPRTLTQTLFAICGIVLMVIGAVHIVSWLRGTRFLEQGGDPNIIDADN